MNDEKNIKSTEYVSIREANIITGIHPQTLRKLGDQQKIKCYKTLSGQRKFNRSCLEKMCNGIYHNDQISEHKKQNFIYTRVSSKKQMDDISRQIEFIKSNNPKYTTYISISDVASGINFKRKGLSTILESCLQRSIGEIIIAHRDRLCRFGFDLLKLIIEKQGGKITVINDDIHKSTEQELSEDLLSIIHIYSCRQMGKRSYKIRNNKNAQSTSSSEPPSTENNQ
jgi:predicted site-specific integrase-resolvase